MENKNSVKIKISKYSIVICTLLPANFFFACKQKNLSTEFESNDNENPESCPNCNKGLWVKEGNCPYCGFYLGYFSSKSAVTNNPPRLIPRRRPVEEPSEEKLGSPTTSWRGESSGTNYSSNSLWEMGGYSSLPSIHIPQPPMGGNSSFNISFGSGGNPFHNDGLAEAEGMLFDRGMSPSEQISEVSKSLDRTFDKIKKSFDEAIEDGRRYNEMKRKEREEDERRHAETDKWLEENAKRRERHKKIFEKYLQNPYNSRRRKEIDAAEWRTKKLDLEDDIEFYEFVLSDPRGEEHRSRLNDDIKKKVEDIRVKQKKLARQYIPLKYSLDPRADVCRQSPDNIVKTVEEVKGYLNYYKSALESMEEILQKFNGNKEKISFKPYEMPADEEKKEILTQEEELNQIWQESRETQKMITKQYNAVKSFNNEEHFNLLYNSYVQLSADISSRLPLPSPNFNYLYDSEDSKEVFLEKVKKARSPLDMYAHYTKMHPFFEYTEKKEYIKGKKLNNEEFIPLLNKILEKKDPNIHRYALNYADLMRRKYEMEKEPQKVKEYKSLIEFNLNIDMKGASLINLSLGGGEPQYEKKSLLNFSLLSPLINQAINLINSNFGEILKKNIPNSKIRCRRHDAFHLYN